MTFQPAPVFTATLDSGMEVVDGQQERILASIDPIRYYRPHQYTSGHNPPGRLTQIRERIVELLASIMTRWWAMPGVRWSSCHARRAGSPTCMTSYGGQWPDVTLSATPSPLQMNSGPLATARGLDSDQPVTWPIHAASAARLSSVVCEWLAFKVQPR